MSAETAVRRGMPLHTKILIGLFLGAAAGVTANALWADAPALDWVVNNVAQPIGQIFLSMLFMVVVPLIFTSLALGVASLGDIRKVGRIGMKTIGFFLFTTAIAASLGLLLVNIVRPGDSLDPADRAMLQAEYTTQANEKVSAAETSGVGVNTIVNIVPRNPVSAAANGDMLPLIFFTLVFGIALTQVRPEAAAPVLRVLEGIGQAVMVIIEFAMKLAPYGVFGLIFAVTAKLGLDVLGTLGRYVIMVLAALAFHQFVVLGVLAKLLIGISPLELIRRTRTLATTAFSTSSSNATLPTTIRTAQEQFGVPASVAGFVLPLGATMNMNGTAMFEGMTVLFLAQVFGVDLSLSTQFLVICLSVITAIGVAGVPGGSIPLLVLVLEMVGIPGAGIGLILGVDRILDMARTVPNVTGDLLTSLWITKSEGLPFQIPETIADEVAHPSATDVAAA